MTPPGRGTAPPLRRVAAAPARPLLVYDGACGFCRDGVARWREAAAGRVDYAASQEVAPRFPEIPQAEYRRAVLLIEPDGSVTGGAHALFRTLALERGRRGPLRAYERIPGVRLVSEALYRIVARNRDGLSGLIRWIARPAPPP